ncbi:ABC transporter permease [Lactobacillus gasseri]|nr:ABC transporter permease [Lactobacillus gasseri]MCZ3582928.1 ABC transporter permease [Lactobacillus gasseri]MCZ3584672.1 ABC transporter permease [Lactobacillus gasseri]MCZ3588353.1 ABC transporter permease [Lactobacillus gasseri]MCZ3594068.1 ABC transporter permease [Lactobacillus gasseri]
MTSFSSIFKELTKSKLRLVRRLALLQIVVGVLLGFWALLKMAFQGESKSYMLTAFITITPLFDLAYLFLSSRKNEQVYASQTWRLAPIKNSALLFANLGSAIIDGIFLVILQIVMMVIAGLPVIITNEFWQTTFKNFGSIGEGKLWQDIHLADLLSVILLIILIGMFIYLAVSLINFTGKIVSDFLPEKISKLVYFLVVVSLTCIGLIFLMNVYWFVMNSLTGFLQNGMFLTTLSKDAIDVRSNLTENYLTMAVVLVVDIILIIVNIFLLNKYHEAKI